jgi:hypothetical protein
MAFALTFCQKHSQELLDKPSGTAAAGSNFLWRILSESVMQETSHLLPMQLHVFYTFKV